MIGLRFTAKPAVLFAVAAIVFQPALSQSTAHRTAPVPGNIHTMAVPTARVVAKVDNGNRTTLYGHLSAALLRATDMGRLDPSTPSEHMVMVLKSSDDQERELRRLLDEQQDSKTANYHQWATPEQFGQYFGVHDSDIAQVSAWLESQGFTVGRQQEQAGDSLQRYDRPVGDRLPDRNAHLPGERRDPRLQQQRD